MMRSILRQSKTIAAACKVPQRANVMCASPLAHKRRILSPSFVSQTTPLSAKISTLSKTGKGRSIMVAVDGQLSSDYVIDVVANDVARDEDHITILTVHLPVNLRTPSEILAQEVVEEITKKEVAQITQIMHAYAEKFNEIGISNEVIIAEGTVEFEVLATEEDVRPDLIVVGAHHSTALTRMLVGSVCDAIVHQSKASVLVVKAPTED